MKKTQDQRGTDGSPDGAEPARNDTVTAQGERQAVQPRTPNEHDESADSQAPAAASQQRVGKIAHDDLAQGKQDTSKQPEMDAAYDQVVGHEKK